MTRIVPPIVLFVLVSPPAWARSTDTRLCVEVVVRHAPRTKKKKKNEKNEKVVLKQSPPTSQPSLDETATTFSRPEPPEQSRRPPSTRLDRGVDRSLLPLGHTPQAYLERLFEHFITHKKGFVAVAEGCAERINIELYPLQEGWTVFARYSGHGREERVDNSAVISGAQNLRNSRPLTGPSVESVDSTERSAFRQVF